MGPRFLLCLLTGCITPHLHQVEASTDRPRNDVEDVSVLLSLKSLTITAPADDVFELPEDLLELDRLARDSAKGAGAEEVSKLSEHLLELDRLLQETSADERSTFDKYLPPAIVVVAIGALLLGLLCICTCGAMRRRSQMPLSRGPRPLDSQPVEVWERKAPRKQQHRLEELFEELDDGEQTEDNPPGYLNASDLYKAMSDKRVAAEFKRMGLTQAESSTVFRLLDRNGSGLVSLSEFIDGCTSLGVAPDHHRQRNDRKLHHFALHHNTVSTSTSHPDSWLADSQHM